MTGHGGRSYAQLYVVFNYNFISKAVSREWIDKPLLYPYHIATSREEYIGTFFRSLYPAVTFPLTHKPVSAISLPSKSESLSADWEKRREPIHDPE
jgi:hypothetical protein